MPINDVLIMDNNVACLPGKVGEVWIRGPNVMKGYWKDADATAKVSTPLYMKVLFDGFVGVD